MDRLDRMRLFVRVVERRNFTAAAADLGLPRSTATEAVLARYFEGRIHHHVTIANEFPLAAA